MCNLYNVRSNREAILDLTRGMVDRIGLNEPSRDIYPGTLAPIVRIGTDGEREMVMATWGMPTPPERIRGNYDPGLTFAAACAAHGWTRNQCTEELRVPRSTYDKWCDGGKCDREASRRRLMSLIDQTTP